MTTLRSQTRGTVQDQPVVLIVDDEQSSLDYLHGVLHRDYQLILSSSPKDALAKLRSTRIDVIVADHRLPEMTGVELLAQAHTFAPDATRVLVGGLGDAKVLAEAINRAAVHHFLEKPFSVQRVRQAVGAAVPRCRRGPPRVLLATNEQGVARTLRDLLEEQRYEVVHCADLQAAGSAIPEADALILDLELGPALAALLLSVAERARPPVPVLVFARESKIDQALALMRLGAHDVFLRPFHYEEVALRITRACERRGLQNELLALRRDLDLQRSRGLCDFVGTSDKMQSLYDTISRIAEVDTTVLIRGETGTGKELVARVLHRLSRRRAGPFVAVNCAAIPEALIESDLFGHEKGSFTGAHARQVGRFEAASGGTLLLDEIGDMPLAAQSKLLRVLEQREIERVGGRGAIKVDVRVVAATNVDLAEAVAAGRFRADLWYRLNVVALELPPLRERREDIRSLVGHYLALFEKRMDKESIAFQEDALAYLESLPWPGNVRELCNTVERVVALTPSGGLVGAAQLAFLNGQCNGAAGRLSAPATVSAHGRSIKDAVDELERAMVVDALRQHKGNQTRAAAQLGIARQSLAQKMVKLGLLKAEA